jgi:hypothetical protein
MNVSLALRGHMCGTTAKLGINLAPQSWPVKDKIWEAEYTPKKGPISRSIHHSGLRTNEQGEALEGMCNDAKSKIESATKRLKMTHIHA